ncbi:MAG TPA: DUF1552 domain-containing protein [Polyangia bacterium]|jgi:hypothetical protein|nr:DUF1552 domain-containing protein [Polyangia bacterium]
MKTSTRYGRRAFLAGGSSVLIGLPFLEALAPRKAFGQAATAPKRFIGYYAPNGMWMNDFRPTGVGPTFQWGPTMGPSGRVWNDGLPAYPVAEDGPSMEAVRSHVMIITGLQNTLQAGRVPGDHSGGTGSFMTNRTVSKAANATMVGPSIDYVISKQIRGNTKRPYLIMSGEVGRPAGNPCDSGFSCAVGGSISFDDMGKNLPRLEDPGKVFDEIFMGSNPPPGPGGNEILAQRRALNRSILDLVNKEAGVLQPKLSYQDRPRLDEYLTSIREVERRIANLPAPGAAGTPSCMMPAMRPNPFQGLTVDKVIDPGEGSNPRQASDICHQLMALAFQCDATRVISFMWGNSTNARPHTFIGASGGHHDVSHHGGAATGINKLKRIDYWFFRRFADLLIKLKGMPDIDGRTVLDNTLIFLSSDVSDGNAHTHVDMPVVLAGGATGFKMGQHVMAPMAWFGDLFISIAKGYGLDMPTFGEMGKAPLPNLV